MALPERRLLSDIRGASRLAFDATAGIAGLVGNMHRTIQMRPGPLGDAVPDGPRGLTGFVYRTVEGSIRLLGRGIDASLAPLEHYLPAGDSSPGRDVFLSALNGIYGDYLEQSRNPLAIDMSLHYLGTRLEPESAGQPLTLPLSAPSSGRLLVLVHGLCLNERHWIREGHDHGARLAEELGYSPLYLRYNSGMSIAHNGRELANKLDQLVKSWPVPVEELVIVGHSMGGLVGRSACHQAELKGLSWLKSLHKLVCLGSPHHGTVLERGGHWLDSALALSPYSAPFARIGKRRSAGITDLRHGSITDGEHEFVPLPKNVMCFALAATLGSRRDVLSERLIGDGLVPLNSALGQHKDPGQTLSFPRHRQWIGHGIGHLELLNHPEVYRRLRTWLAED